MSIGHPDTAELARVVSRDPEIHDNPGDTLQKVRKIAVDRSTTHPATGEVPTHNWN